MNNVLKKLIPELRFEEFSEEYNKWTNFDSVVNSTLYGPRFNAKDYNVDGNVKTIRGTDVDNNGEFKYEQVPIAIIDKSIVNSHKLLDGDLVMITTAECGQTGVFRSQNIDYISSAYGVRIRLNNNAYPEYFKYFFQTRHAKKEIASYVRKATVANLPGSAILKIKINLIPKKEQQKIANFLTAVDQRISLLKQKKAALETYKKGLMQKIFSQEIRFKDDNGEDYLDWEEKRLGEVCNIQMGTSPKSSAYNNENYGLPLIQGNADIKDRQSNPRVFTSEITKECFSNDLLLSVRAPVGEVSKSNHHACIGRGMSAISSQNGTVIEFIFQYLLWFEPRWKSISQGSTFESVNTKDITGLKLNLPSKEEQNKIADCLSSMDQSINKLKNQIEQTAQFKKGLLQRMFV